MKLLTQPIGGGRIQRCDARCYGAKSGGHCDCICGGKNHAVGFAKALENVRSMIVEDRTRGTEIRVTRAAERALKRGQTA